jgi:hypothetical protein
MKIVTEGRRAVRSITADSMSEHKRQTRRRFSTGAKNNRLGRRRSNNPSEFL